MHRIGVFFTVFLLENIFLRKYNDIAYDKKDFTRTIGRS